MNAQPLSPTIGLGGSAYSAPCEARGPLIAPFEIVESAADDPGRPVKFAPERLGHVDRARSQAANDLRDAELRRERLLCEQDRIIREMSELDATIFFLSRTIQSADAVCDRG